MPRSGRSTLLHRLLAAAILTLAAAIAGSTPAGAVPPSAGWTVDSLATPTDFSGGHGAYQFIFTNAGSAPTSGSFALSAALPSSGVTVQSVELLWPSVGGEANLFPVLETYGYCSMTPTIHCTNTGSLGELAVRPDESLKLLVNVTVDPSAPPTLETEASISGGGGAEARLARSNPVSPTQPPFGASSFDFYIAGLNGAQDTQAGDHPYELNTTIDLNNAVLARGPESEGQLTSVQDPKDIVVDLPLGFVGSTLAAPECTLAQLSALECPPDTIVGHISTEPEKQISSVNSPLYNIVPERGAPAEFGYVDTLHAAHVLYTHVVPTSRGYVLQTTSPDIPEIGMTRIVVTFYGDPAAKQRELAEREGKAPTALPEIPFFTSPTNCDGGPLVATMYMDSWQNPGGYEPDGAPDFGDGRWTKSESASPAVSGCNALSFTPEITAQPTTHEADKPSGMDFEIKVPQSEHSGVPATPTMKRATVTLPEGFTVDPSAGDGLAACSEAQIGWEESSEGPQKFNAAAPACPEASKIGTLELETPLIAHKLEGELFLANQNENPFHSTLAAYVVVNDPITGVLVKIAGKFTPDPHTGRLTAEFGENPNLPFSDLALHFFGGPRAELATPESCGLFTTSAELEPYSAPDSGPSVVPVNNFLINEACPSGFNPTFSALSTNVQAGAFTPFIASFSRSDTDQELSGLSVTLPPGLLGKIAGVPLCAEAQANAGDCPESSQVGTVKAGSGPGPNPLFVSGKAYLTGPYNGGPYGLSVVVPAVAGPFNFGTVVVRQSLRINPLSSQVTDVSDPFPKIIDGIPLRLRRIDVELNRPGFTFNPTSCAPMGFSGSISGSPLGAPTELHGTIGYATQAGSTAPLSAPFQVTDCQALKFTPAFNASVTGKTSKADGAALSVKLSYPAGSMGTQANIAHVKVELPKQLPSRLTTLQQACLAQTFEANPASCPTHSLVGHAKVTTPVLSDPLEGPAYFVSHGSEQFPNLTIVLKGDGVTVQLVGQTFISKSGITSTTFKATPDVPFSAFELTLPQGPYSALTANANLCQAKGLAMPSEFIAQNGAELKQSTPIEVSGCSTKLALLSHKRKGQKLTLSVYAPSAGKVKVSGKGIRTSSKSAKGREVLTLTVPLSSKGHAKTKLKLSFTPSKGARRVQGLALALRT
jgi:hypothetical protein